MSKLEKLAVADLVKNVGLKILQGENDLDRTVTTSDIHRPALELTGYFKHYPAARIQLLGVTEATFAREVPITKRKEYLGRMCTSETPCFVMSTNLPVVDELKVAAAEAHIPILGTHLTSSRILSNMTSYLVSCLAKRESIHGTLIDVAGVGVLITGDSGVGKSETALELIRRGHRLVADDRVVVYARDEQTLVGTAPEILRYFMEVRGIGIVNIMTLYGIGTVMSQDTVDLVIHLETWTSGTQFDRLGSKGDAQKIQNVVIPRISVPVKAGRNLAVIIESAAMNFRAQMVGYDATKIFSDNLDCLIQKNSVRDHRESR